MCTYACATIAAFTWHVYDFDPAISVYVYDSPPGHLLIAMRCAGGAWLSLDALSQRAHFKTKVGFYWWFSVVGGLWTASVPFVVFVAALAPDTERLKVTNALEPCLALAVQGALCFLFLPLKQWNPHFPFHSNVTNAAASSLSIKWARDKRPKASDDDGRPLASVSGGRGRGVNDKGQYVIEDGFEALHVQRLKHIHRALESRLDALHAISRDLNDALKVVDLGDDEAEHRTRSGRPSLRGTATPTAPPRRPAASGDRDEEKREVAYEMVGRRDGDEPGAYGEPEAKTPENFPDAPPPESP